MTYAVREESAELGLPATLYFIKYGDQASNYFAYCDVDQPVTYGGITYTPIVIGREKIEASGGLDNKTLEIDITPNASVVAYYQGKRPSQVVTMTIYAGHIGDPDTEFIVAWTGRLISIELKEKFAKIFAEPIATSMRRPGLRRHYTFGCPFVLYGSECGALQSAARVVANVTGINPNALEFAGGWEGTKPKAKFRGGFLRWTDTDDGSTQVRTILNTAEAGAIQSPGDDLLTINGGTPGITVGTAVELFLGCNHQLEDCTNLHVQADGVTPNTPAYGGQPWIPKANPFGYVNRFY